MIQLGAPCRRRHSDLLNGLRRHCAQRAEHLSVDLENQGVADREDSRVRGSPVSSDISPKYPPRSMVATSRRSGSSNHDNSPGLNHEHRAACGSLRDDRLAVAVHSWRRR